MTYTRWHLLADLLILATLALIIWGGTMKLRILIWTLGWFLPGPRWLRRRLVRKLARRGR